MTPPDVSDTFSSSHAQNFQKLWSNKSAAERAQKAAAAGDKDETFKQSLESAKIGSSILGGVVFDSLIAALVLVGTVGFKSVHRVISAGRGSSRVTLEAQSNSTPGSQKTP